MKEMEQKGSGNGRLNFGEVVEGARRDFSFELVDGVDSILKRSRATRNGTWVTSFLDARCAYYIHQNGKDFLEWKTKDVPHTNCLHVVFVFSVGMGFGSCLPQPSGQFDLYLNDDYFLSFRVTKEDELWGGNEAFLYFWKKKAYVALPHMILHMDDHIKEESTACYGLAFLKVPVQKTRQGKNIIRIVPRNRHSSSRWFKLDLSRWANPILKADISTGLEIIHSKNHLTSEIDGYRVAFGDIHSHSGKTSDVKKKGCGLGSVDENYLYARDIACLDFYSLTDHDWQLTEEDWRLRLEKADQYNKEGSFITIPGFEWTSAKYGHRNVYYLTTGPLLKSHPENRINAIDDECRTPNDLWEELDRLEVSALTVAHHPSVSYFPVDWTYENEKYDRLVEIYSCWGNSEYYGAPFSGTASDRRPDLSVYRALKDGHRLGIIVSSDSHDGHPGNAQWSSRQPHLHPWLGSGRVAVLVEGLTRQEIFNALYARRCYGTTGTRIVLDFRVNGQCMGSEISLKEPNQETSIEIFIKGTSPIKKVDLVSNEGELSTWQIDGLEQEVKLSFRDNTGIDKPIFYYVRVTQMDEERAWSSPIWVTPSVRNKREG